MKEPFVATFRGSASIDMWSTLTSRMAILGSLAVQVDPNLEMKRLCRS